MRVDIKKIFFLSILSFSISLLLGQNQDLQPNVYANFSEFHQNKPSTSLKFQVKRKNAVENDLMGGFFSYYLKRIEPKTETSKLNKEVWGVAFNDTAYINGYPYLRQKRYYKILEKGYYSFFIGEPPVWESEQRKLGIINEDNKGEKCLITPVIEYVILPDGSVKYLGKDLFLKLISDDEELTSELKKEKNKKLDREIMFEYLKKYNSRKGKNE